MHLEEVGSECGEGANDTKNIEPERAVDVWEIEAEAHLKEKGRQSDGGNHYQGDRAPKGIGASVDDNQGQSQDQQA
jgi:hypothetical protein